MNVKTLILPLVVLGGSAYAMPMDYKPYVGLEGGMHHMKFSNQYGGNQFYCNYPKLSILAGVKFKPFMNNNASMAVEVSAMQSAKRRKNAKVVAGDIDIFGDTVAAGDIEYNRTNNSIKGADINLLGFYGIAHNTQLVGSVGMAYRRINATYSPYETESGSYTPAQIQQLFRNFKHSKVVVQFKAGIEQKLNSQLSLRVTAGFENTAKFHTLGPKQSSVAKIKPMNALTGNLGLVWSF